MPALLASGQPSSFELRFGKSYNVVSLHPFWRACREEGRLAAVLGCHGCRHLHSYLVFGLVHYIRLSCLILSITRIALGELRIATNLCGLSSYMYRFFLISWTGILCGQFFSYMAMVSAIGVSRSKGPSCPQNQCEP